MGVFKLSRIHLLKFLDRWLGTALASLLPRPPSPPRLSPPRTILLIRPGGIGDAVLLAPAIQTLHEHFPEAAIDLLVERRNTGALALCPGIRAAFLYDRPGQLLEVLRRRYDVVIDTEQWHRLSAVIARLVRAPVKIGFATNQRQRLFTHAISYRHDDYEVLSFLRLLEPLGIARVTLPTGAWLQIPESARSAAEQLLPSAENKPMVALFPGASIREKYWGAERFRTVAQWCLAHGFGVVVIGGGGERAEASKISADLDVVNLAGQTYLAVTAAIIARAAAVVSGDSGVLHIAAGLDCPSVALFGPSSAVKWAPQGSRHVVLRPTDCPSCAKFGYTPACPHEVRCLREITVDAVIEAIKALPKRG